MTCTGAQMVVKALEAEGVSVVFGIPGGPIIPLYDALMDAPFRHILVRHEQAACHAADGYARVTGRPGVCIATSGPGATNVITGMATAAMDSVPLVVIAGQVARPLLGSDAFQEADIFGMTLSVVKHSFFVQHLAELPRALRGAFYLAASGRPGPVLVTIPVDVLRASGPFFYPTEVTFPGYRPGAWEDLSRLDEAADLLRRAERPVFLVGGGVIRGEAWDPLFRAATRHGVPVATTLMGKGAFPESSPLALGLLGMHGTPVANRALTEADLVVAVGTRFSDRSTGQVARFAPRARVIHADLDPAELGKNVPIHLGLVGEARKVLEALAAAPAAPEGHRREWHATLEGWRQKHPLRDPRRTDGYAPWDVLDAVRARAGEDALVTTEVGQHQMWTALHWPLDRPRKFLTSGGLGTMGFGLPAALGAHQGAPHRPLVCVAGDGSLLMNVQELDTLAREGVPARVIVFNNGSLGMVRQWQKLFWKERFSATETGEGCRFAALAEAFGARGWTVQTPQELGPALDGAFAARGPSLVDVRLPREEMVFPMVPAGEALENFIEAGAPSTR